MSFRASRFRLACVCIAVAWAASAQAAPYPITGNARFQIGDGLPMPIGFSAPPAGKIFATPSAMVTQAATGADPRTITIPPGEFHHPGTPPFLLPGFLFAGNSVLQVMTAIHVTLPATPMVPGDPLLNVLWAGGRTGPPTVAWCPGQPIPVGTYNPNCTSGQIGTPLPNVPGRLRYTKTAAQFGGPISAQFGGVVDLALRLFGAPPPCNFETTTCQAFFGTGAPLQTGAIGGSFGRRTTTTGPPPNPGRFNIKASLAGIITYITPTGLGPGLGNPAESWGGPWTTGQLINTALTALGSEMFTRTGSDNRVNGVGTLSLIAGAVSNRGTSGPNANRGWLNITVPEPAAVLSAASGLLLLVACHSLVRRRSG